MKNKRKSIPVLLTLITLCGLLYFLYPSMFARMSSGPGPEYYKKQEIREKARKILQERIDQAKQKQKLYEDHEEAQELIEKATLSDEEWRQRQRLAIKHWQGWTIRNTKESTYNVATGSSQKIIYDQNNLLETTYRKYLPDIQSADVEKKVTKGKDGVLRYDFGTWQGALLPASLVQTSNGEPIFIECTYLRKKNKASRGGGCVSTYEIAPHLKANIKPFEQNMYVDDLGNPDHFLNLVKEHCEKADQFLEANPDFYTGVKGEAYIFCGRVSEQKETNSEVIKNQPEECEKLGQGNNQSSRLLSGKIASASIVDTRKRCEGECWDIESFLHISLETGDKDSKTRIQVTTERSPLPKLKPLLQKIREEKDNKTYEFCAYQRAYDDPFMQQAYGGWYHIKLEELSPRK